MEQICNGNRDRRFWATALKYRENRNIDSDKQIPVLK
jgi:hypothetical protein